MRTNYWIFTGLLTLGLTAGCADDGETMMTDAGEDPMQDGSTSGNDGGTTMTEDGSMDTEDATAEMAMPLGAKNRPALGAQIDRTGRPAISTALQATFEADEAMKGSDKDAYNAATFDDWSSFASGFAGSLAILDALDGTCGNQLLAGDPGEGRYDALAGVLADDQLYVDSSRGTCGVYLGLEGEFVGAVAEGDGGCGGRLPTEDVIERSYSVLAAGALSGVDDTITEDDATHDPTTFPFLSAPL